MVGEGVLLTELVWREPQLPLHTPTPPSVARLQSFLRQKLDILETPGTEGTENSWDKKQFWGWRVRIPGSTPLCSQNISPAPLYPWTGAGRILYWRNWTAVIKPGPYIITREFFFKIYLLKISICEEHVLMKGQPAPLPRFRSGFPQCTVSITLY